MTGLPPLPDLKILQERLRLVFAEGTADRQYVVREMAARTVFAMLYIGAVEGTGVWLAPKQVCRMSDEQAALTMDLERAAFRTQSMRGGFEARGRAWFKDNTREPIRDETLRQGLITNNAVIVREGLATTSSLGRYGLRRSFAELITQPDEDSFAAAATAWAARHLRPDQLAKVAIMRDRVSGKEAIEVHLPRGGSRMLSPGPSSVLAKAVIEQFAARHLAEPAVLWISESATKVPLPDQELMGKLGLQFDQQRLLPDILLADLGREDILLVFVEIVATDGPVTEDRKADLLAMTRKARFPDAQVAFVSVFTDRGAGPAKARLSSIAVNSFLWFMAEPDLLVWLRHGGGPWIPMA